MANEKRLIDANAILQKIQLECNSYLQTSELTFAGLTIARKIIEETPTVDAAPVVHGHWIFGTANHREYMKCSVCLKSQTPTGVFTYCPNCGAKMGGGNEDG